MQCFVCTKPESESLRLLCCTRCKSAAYCSAECQKADWKFHKKVCGFVNQGIALQITHPGAYCVQYWNNTLRFVVVMLCDHSSSRIYNK